MNVSPNEVHESAIAAKPKRFQFRLSTLFTVTTVVACICGLLHAAGVEGMLVLTVTALMPLVATAIAWIYVRCMSFLFDTIIGPFFLQ